MILVKPAVLLGKQLAVPFKLLHVLVLTLSAQEGALEHAACLLLNNRGVKSVER